ncbi:MAG: hypothetical protein ACRDBH_11625 [Bosea sp. (in: a-proteobacteria)]
MSNSAHAAISHYKNTLADNATSPLIMAVGREPNGNHEEKSSGLGHYDFADAPRCAFWNVSHSVLGRLHDQHVSQVKTICRNAGRSPIVYADALPISLKNAVADKNRHRDLLTDSALADHVAHVFSHEAVMRRVKLVFLSGHNAGDALNRASRLFQEACKAQNIKCAVVPFFYPTNTRKVMDALTPDVRELMKSVWASTFDQSHRTASAHTAAHKTA